MAAEWWTRCAPPIPSAGLKSGSLKHDGVSRSAPARILLTNLISNALKFTAKEPAARIEIGSEMVDGDTRSSSGQRGGLRHDLCPQAFGAFQRLHSQSEFPGVGMAWPPCAASSTAMAAGPGPRRCRRGATFYFVF